MVKLMWDEIGDRYFEAGVDRGVLYTVNGNGVAWNGLTTVTESPSGGKVTPYYLDGVKYLNVVGLQEFGGSIEAFTYPDEFSVHDGTAHFGGLSIHQQRRKPFSLSYRTGIGNDVDGQTHAYKIHIIYNATASPSEIAYSTIGADIEAIPFSWEFTTMPVGTSNTANLLPLSHVSIDSRKTPDWKLKLIEDHLYGSSTQVARVLSFEQLITLFEDDLAALSIQVNSETGINTLVIPEPGEGDLVGATDEGTYTAATTTRLTPTAQPGIYTLE